MYFKLESKEHQIDHDIVANDPSDAVVIGHELYPDVNFTYISLTHEEFHGKNN